MSAPAERRRRFEWRFSALSGLLAVLALTSLFFAAPLDVNIGLVAAGLWGAGALAATVVPQLARSGVRLAGLGLLSLALLPGFTSHYGWLALPTLVLGSVSVDLRALSRVVLAMPIVLASVAYNADISLSSAFVALWAVFAVVNLLFVNQQAVLISEHGLASTLSEAHTSRVVAVWRRPLSAMLAVTAVAPVAILASHTLNLPDAVTQAQSASDLLPNGESTSYPGFQGSLDVGSPVELSDDVVLRVVSDRAYYWRAATYENWNGRVWSSTNQRGASELATLPIVPKRDGEPPIEVTTSELAQSFRVEAPGIDVLLGAPQISRVVGPSESVEYSSDGSIWLPEPLAVGSEWTVYSSIADASIDTLRSADNQSLPDAIFLGRYAAEDDVDPKVSELADTITAAAPTAYDKVKAIESWMGQNLIYDRNIPELGADQDAVTNLLFETKIGFCEQVGSALVVMLRSLGIPARLAVGYVPGSYDESSGEWLSRGVDAHSWAEVYFPGVGWHGFDPTAVVPLASPAPAQAATTWPVFANFTAVGIVVGLISSATLASAVIWRWRPKGRRPRPTPLQLLQRRFDACGAEVGQTWSSSMTLSERSLNLIAAGLDASLVSEAAQLLQRFHYSPPSSVDDHLFARAQNLVSELELRCQRLERNEFDSGNHKSAELVG